MSGFSIRLHPSRKKEETFIINYKHHIPQQFPQRPQHFDDYIQMQEEWVKKMISRYRQNVLEESLLTHIHLKSSLLISTDGAKGKRKSGGGWVLTLDNGHHLVEEYNPNFGQSNKITSYRSEAYAVLSATLFLHHCCNFFGVSLNNTITTGFDNQALVDKLSWLLEDPYYQSNFHNETDSEALRIILKIIPENYKILHVYGHQVEKSKYEKLTIDAKLNVDSDRLDTTNKKLPINTNINSYPFSIYIKGKYAYHHSYENIRIESHADEAQDWLKSKYSWSSKAYQTIDWDNHSKVLNTQPASQRRMSVFLIKKDTV